MAVNFWDPRSGFSHSEVVRFINEEILINGGGPEFYLTYRSRPWNQVEDQVRAVVTNPQMPRAIKRACTWSALALSVRFAARQQRRAARRVRRLRQQVTEREAAAWALATELLRLRENQDDMALQLRLTQDDLQQSMDEQEVLRGRLLQAERSAQFHLQLQGVDRQSRSQEQRANSWLKDREEQGTLPEAEETQASKM